MYVTNDILNSLDRINSVFLVLLDLSAVFDMVDHKKLLDRLEKTVGVGGLVLDWVVSYTSSRYQYVLVAGSALSPGTWPVESHRAQCWGQSSSLSICSL